LLVGQKETGMQHARVGVYESKPGMADEAIRKAQSGMLPVFQRQPGFVGYGLVKTSDHSLISLSFWETEDEAEKAVQTAAGWVKENLGDILVSVQNHVGDLSFFNSKAPVGS
jgi:hypothetical protein